VINALCQDIRSEHPKDFDGRDSSLNERHCQPFGVRQLCCRFSSRLASLCARPKLNERKPEVLQKKRSKSSTKSHIQCSICSGKYLVLTNRASNQAGVLLFRDSLLAPAPRQTVFALLGSPNMRTQSKRRKPLLRERFLRTFLDTPGQVLLASFEYVQRLSIQQRN
jgi:hypothetical protein